MSTSNPVLQIAYQILRNTTCPPESRAELKTDAAQLASLFSMADLCPSCWQLYSCGTRGRTTCTGNGCLLGETA
jgi:hypothetical protein